MAATRDSLTRWRQPGAVAVPVLGVLVVGALVAAVLHARDPVTTFEVAVGALAAVAIFAIGIAARPAWTVSVGIALTIFSTHWTDMGLPSSVDRIVLASGALGVGWRELRAGRRLRTQPVHWLLLLVVIYALTSGLLAGTLSDRQTQFVLLDRLGLIPYVMFFLAPMIYRSERDRRVLLYVLLALGTYLGVTALVETTGPTFLVVPHYISDPALGIHFGRARGPFLEGNANGLALFACAVAAAMWAATSASRARTSVARGLVVLCVLGVVLTLTRGAWIAAAIGMVLALLCTQRSRRALIPVLAVGSLMVVVALAAIPGLSASANSRLNDQRPIWDRENSDAAALRMVAKHPLFGFGLGEFPFESADYYRQSPDYPLSGVRDLHSVYLDYASELGLLGAGLWALAILGALAASLRHRGAPNLMPWRLGLVAVAGSWMTTAASNPQAFPFPTLLLWTWAGLVYGGSRSQDDAEEQRAAAGQSVAEVPA